MSANSRRLRRFRTSRSDTIAALVGAIIFGAGSVPVRAACTCICVDGLNRPLCSEVTDVEPVCPPRLCPDAPRATPPLDLQRLPPTGTRSCAMEYVYNPYARRYEWRQLCQ
jgi:hypothetical protein